MQPERWAGKAYTLYITTVDLWFHQLYSSCFPLTQTKKRLANESFTFLTFDAVNFNSISGPNLEEHGMEHRPACAQEDKSCSLHAEGERVSSARRLPANSCTNVDEDAGTPHLALLGETFQNLLKAPTCNRPVEPLHSFTSSNLSLQTNDKVDHSNGQMPKNQAECFPRSPKSHTSTDCIIAYNCFSRAGSTIVREGAPVHAPNPVQRCP